MRGKRLKGPERLPANPSVAMNAFRTPARGLPLERVRTLLGPDCCLGEEDLKQLRDQMTTLADALVDTWESAARQQAARSAAAESRRTS